MWLNGKFMSDTEVSAYVENLLDKMHELEEKVKDQESIIAEINKKGEHEE